MKSIAKLNPLPDLQWIWQLRLFLWSLVRMDIQSRYRRSYLGIGWSLLRPLAMAGVFCFVFSQLFEVTISEYLPFLLVGLSIWQYLVESALQGCSTFSVSVAYVRQQPLPLLLFPLRTVLSTGFHAFIALALAVFLSWLLQGMHHLAALPALIPGVILLFVLGWSLAVMAGVAQSHFPDTKHLLEIVIQILFYLSPILYPPETIRSRHHLSWVIDLNPVTHLLALVRDPVVYGVIPSLRTFGICLAIVCFVGLLGVYLLKKTERNLVFWI